MTQKNNTSYLGMLSMPEDDPNAKIMVDIDHVTMIFNIASEQLNSLKEYAIALSRRELSFKEFRALDDVSFKVKQGDVFGILGTNGSGKSTMLKIIAGVLEPSKGTCTVSGSIAPLIELGAGFDLELTARENIFLNGALLGYSKKFIKQHFDEIVDFAEVRDFLDMPMKNYSSGMVARIAFAIATVIIPDILIVDEVLSVGDFMFQQKCEKRIQSLIKEHGVTVLIVSHNNDQIERLCNKAVWIEKGHLRAIGAAKDVCEVYRAVGGRSGSAESEKTILELLEKDTIVKSELRQSVSGDNRFSTAVRANDFAGAPSDIIVVTNSNAGCENRMATSLAGVLDASLLTVDSERIPDVTMQEIKHRSPKKIVLVGDESQIRSGLFAELSHSTNPVQIDRIQANDRPISCNVVSYVRDRGEEWGDTAVVAGFTSQMSMLAIAPYLFTHKVPVFYLTETKLTDSEYACLSTFDHLIMLASIDELSDDEVHAFAPHAQITRIDEGDYAKANEAVNAWMRAQRKATGGSEHTTLLITAPDNDPDNCFAGPLAGRISADILIEDPRNLDSISHVVSTVKKHYPRVDSIVYLGNDMYFSSLYKELIAKALA